MFKFSISAISLLCFCATSSADIVMLKNGDNVSGNIKLVDSNKVLIETEYAGTITINSDKIESFSIDTPIRIKSGLFSDPVYADSIKPAKDGAIVLVQDKNNDVINLTKDLTITKENNKSLNFSNWIVNGNVNVGAYYNKGEKTSQQYSVKGNVSLKHDLWRHNLNGSFYRSTNSEKTENYYYNTGYEIDRFITPDFFIQGNLGYQHDWIESIKQKTTVGIGPGWQIWENELSALSLAMLINYQHLNYRNNSDANNAIGSLKWNYYQYFLGKSIKFYTNGSVGRSFDDAVDLELTATAGLSYKLTDSISLNTGLTRQQTDTKKGNSNNTNYSIGVGVNW